MRDLSLPEGHALLRQFRSINIVNPSRVDEQLFAVVQKRIKAIKEYERENPCRPAPTDAFPPGITIGYEKATGRAVTESPIEQAAHTIIVGQSGSGKTTATTHVVRQSLDRGVIAWIPDAKDDYRKLALDYGFLILDLSTIPFNPLQRLEHLSTLQLITTFNLTFSQALWSGQNQQAVITKALHAVYASIANPTLRDLQREVDAQYSPKLSFAERDQLRGVSNRLQQLLDVFPGLATTGDTIPFEDLFTDSMSLPFGQEFGSAGQFLVSFLVHHLYLHQRAHQHRGRLSHLVLIDEGLQTMGAKPNSIDGMAALSHLQSVVREFGIGLLVTTTNLGLTDPLLKSNAGTIIALKTSSGTEHAEVTRTLGLTPDESRYYQHDLQLGEALARVPSSPRTILLTIPPPTEDKNVSPDAWAAAIARTRDHVIPTATTSTLPALPAPPQPEGSTSAPVAHPEMVMPEDRPIALNTNQEQLLRSVVAVIAPVTTHYEVLGLHPEEGNAARKQLVLLGLVTEAPIVVRRGKGGRAIALVPTTAGIERSGTQPPKGTRGGDSVQHQYLVQELARLLTGAKAEATVGTKSVDLLLTYHEAEHTRLRIALNTAAPTVSITEGQVIAFEVEISSPDKTIPSNASKNHDAGIPLTVIAVMPKALPIAKRTIARLDKPLRTTLALVNALLLLEYLRAPLGGTGHGS
ncbi:MAG: hypothetical protein ACHREM_11965 [Polyangiales bacterium]